MTNSNSSVLVTSAHTRAALAVTKSLGKKGIEVICADHMQGCVSFYSKYCKGRIIYPDPAVQPAKYISFLADHLKNNHYDLLYPITDTDMYLITKFSDKLTPYVKIAMNPHERYMIALDKLETLRIASQLGIPTPETIQVNDILELEGIAKDLKYPVIIKPRQSITSIDGKLEKGITTYISNRDELIIRYKELHNRIPYPLIQEYISGEESGVFILLDRGEIKAIFGHKRIRSIDPLGGASCLREGVELDPLMRDYAIRILKRIGWDGAAMVEFKTDSKDGVPRLMEINGRLWGSLQLAVSSGVDFPYLLFQMSRGEQITPVLSYKKGIKLRDTYNDCIHLFYTLFRRDNRFEYPPRLPTLLEFFNIFEKNLEYEGISLDDPLLALKFITDIATLPKLVLKSRSK